MFVTGVVSFSLFQNESALKKHNVQVLMFRLLQNHTPTRKRGTTWRDFKVLRDSFPADDFGCDTCK